MNIFKRLFRIGKAEASSSLSSSESTNLIAEGEKELTLQKERLAGLQKEGAEEAVALAQNISEWESILQTAKKKTQVLKSDEKETSNPQLTAKPGKKNPSITDKAKSQLLDRDGDGSVMDDIGGMIGGFTSNNR